MVPYFAKWKINSTLITLSKIWTLTIAVAFQWAIFTSIYSTPLPQELSSFIESLVILRFCSEIFSDSFANQCSVVYSFFFPSSLYIQPFIASWIFISIHCPLPFRNYSVPWLWSIILAVWDILNFPNMLFCSKLKGIRDIVFHYC